MSPEKFRNRRFENWIFLGLMYGFFYLSRYNLGSIQVALGQEFGWSTVDYGWVLAAGHTIYALAVFLNGPLADKIGGKKAILIGAAGASLFNLLFGLCHLFLIRPAIWSKIPGQAATLIQPALLAEGMKNSTMIATFAVIWACNNYFQSFGALSIVKINASWFHVKERGRFAGIFGIMIQGGRLLAQFMGPFLLRKHVPWEYAFYIPAVLLLIMWVVGYIRIHNSPAHAGLGDYDTGDVTIEEAKEKPTMGFILRKIFAQPTTWIIALTSMCLGLVRHSTDGWYIRYLSAVFNVSNAGLANFAPYQFTYLAMPFAAVLGGLVAGNASDRIFKSRRAPVICIALLCLGISLLGLRSVITNVWMACMMLTVISFFVQSAHSLLAGTASMDFGGRKAVATAAGFFDGAQYLAGSIISVGMGWVLKHYADKMHPGIEYNIWPLVPIPFTILGAILIATLWNRKPKGHSSH